MRFQIMPSRKAKARNANASPQVLNQEVSNSELRNTIHILAQSVANKKNQLVPVPANDNVGSFVVRVQNFVRMNLPNFLGSLIGEDPQNFIDDIKKIFEVMHLTGNDRVELQS